MNTAWIKFHQIIFLLCKKYCQQKCTNYGYLWLYRGQISSFSFAGFAGSLCCRQSAKASKTFAAGKIFAGAMYSVNCIPIVWQKLLDFSLDFNFYTCSLDKQGLKERKNGSDQQNSW